MIGRITGKLIDKQAQGLLIDVQGVGYEVLVSLNTFFDLPEVGQQVTLHTHFVVREDVQQLYGFLTQRERQLFRDLIKVNGVGPKVALAILSGISVDDFVATVLNNDVVALVRLPGIGKKTAERLLIEMRDRVKDWQPAISPSAAPAVGAFQEDAQSALLALGYKVQEAAKMVAAAARQAGDVQSSEELIRLALRNALK